MDWASAATAAAMSSVISANASPSGNARSQTTKTTYNSASKTTHSNKPYSNKPYSRPPWKKPVISASGPPSTVGSNATYYCEICKISCMGSMVGVFLSFVLFTAPANEEYNARLS